MADLTVRQNAQQVETWFPDAEKHRPLPDPGGHAAKVQNSSLGVGEPPVPPGRLLPETATDIAAYRSGFGFRMPVTDASLRKGWPGIVVGMGCSRRLLTVAGQPAFKML